MKRLFPFAVSLLLLSLLYNPDFLFVRLGITYSTRNSISRCARIRLARVTRRVARISPRNQAEDIFPSEEIAIFVSDVKNRRFFYLAQECKSKREKDGTLLWRISPGEAVVLKFF